MNENNPTTSVLCLESPTFENMGFSEWFRFAVDIYVTFPAQSRIILLLHHYVDPASTSDHPASLYIRSGKSKPFGSCLLLCYGQQILISSFIVHLT